MAHQCSFYCSGHVHAYEFLAPPGMNREDVLHLMTYNVKQGEQVVEVKRAREADVAVWQARDDWRFVGHMALERERYTVPWLVWVRSGEEAR